MKKCISSILLILSLPGMVLAHDYKYCLTSNETSAIISRWTSIAIEINLQVVDETVTDNFQFFSDSQDFLEGLPVSIINGSRCRLQATLIHHLRRIVWLCKRGAIHREQDRPDSATNRRPGSRHAGHPSIIHYPPHAAQLPRNYLPLALPRQKWGRSSRVVSSCSVVNPI